MSRTLARQKAEKKVPTAVGVGKDRRALTQPEWMELVRKEAATIFETAERSVKISPEFDAPQFCRDWIAVAPGEVRLTKIMARGAKTDAEGNRVLRDGRPVMTWLEYDQAAAKAPSKAA
jgi:hypothetical protein